MAGTVHSPGPAWAAIVFMIVGFTMCTVGFVWHNNLFLWIAGGVIGAIGLVLARVYRVLEAGHEAPVQNYDQLTSADHR